MQEPEVEAGRFEDYLPPEMARKGEETGIRKANLNFISMFALAVLAGAFISLGAVFATVALTTVGAEVPWGWTRLVAGLVFSLGLILVIVGIPVFYLWKRHSDRMKQYQQNNLNSM